MIRIGWRLAAAVAAPIDRLLTFADFIPTMLRLMRGELRRLVRVAAVPQ